jgi:hypothetical protein
VASVTEGDSGLFAKVATLVVAAQLLLFPIVFGVAFPWSLATFEVVTLLLFAASIPLLRYAPRKLLAVVLLILGFVAHVALLGGDLAAFDPINRYRGVAPAASGIDTYAAFDAFRRAVVYFALLLLASRLAACMQCRSVLVGALALAAAVLLALGLVAPRDSTDILWFYAVPTHDRYWLSSSVNSLLTSMWGYARPYQVDGIPILLDELQVSARPVGPIFNENQYAAAVGLTFPVLLGWLGSRLDGRLAFHPLLILIPLGMIGCAVVFHLTGSRGGTAALAAGLIGLVVACRGRLALRTYSALIGLAVLAVCVGVPSLYASGGPALAGGRSPIWLQTAQAFLAHPLFGIGLGNFADLGIGTSGPLFVLWCAAHNVYLQIIAEIGLAGVMFLLMLPAVVARAGPRAASANDFVRPGLYGSLVFAAIHAAVDYSPGLPFNAMFVAVTAGLFFGGKGEAARQTTRDAAPIAARSLAATVATVLLAFAATSIQYGIAEARLFAIRDTTAWLLSKSGVDRTALEQRLRELIIASETQRPAPPPSKNHLFSIASAELAMPSKGDQVRLKEAALYLEWLQNVGRYAIALTPTQAALQDRLTDSE